MNCKQPAPCQAAPSRCLEPSSGTAGGLLPPSAGGNAGGANIALCACLGKARVAPVRCPAPKPNFNSKTTRSGWNLYLYSLSYSATLTAVLWMSRLSRRRLSHCRAPSEKGSEFAHRPTPVGRRCRIHNFQTHLGSFMNEIWRKILGTSSARVYSLLVGLASLAVAARMLGPDGRGLVAGVMAWASLFATLGSLSLGQVVVHHAAKQRGKAWLEPLFGALLFLTLFLTVLIWFVAAGIGYFKEDLYGKLPVWALHLGFLSVPFLIWQSYGLHLLISSGNLDFYNRAQVFASSIGFLFIVVALVVLDSGVEGALIATLMTTAIISCVGITKLWALAGGKIAIQPKVIRALIKDGLKLHLNAVGGVLLTALLTLVSGAVNIFLNALFIPRYGMIAAAWSTAFVYSMGFLTNFSMAVYVESRWRSQYALTQREVPS